MKLEVAKLAQRLKLTKEQLRSPRVIALLEEHLGNLKKIEASVAPELPKKRPGAINHSYGYYDYRQTRKEN